MPHPPEEPEVRAGVARAREHMRQAEAHRAAGSLHDALTLSERATVEFARAGNRGGRAGALNLSGQLLGALGQADEAVRHFDEARSICVASGQMVAAAVCDREVAVVLDRAGRTTAARERLKQAYAGFVAAGDGDRASECQALLDTLGAARTATRAMPPVYRAQGALPPGTPLVRRRAIQERRPGLWVRPVGLAVIGSLVVGVVVWAASNKLFSDSPSKSTGSSSGPTKPATSNITAPGGSPIYVPAQPGIFSDPALVGKPYPGVAAGMISFRGNPTRSYYGKGPVPKAPKVLWRYPKDGPMCSESTDKGTTSTWCGQGWTGQVNVFMWKGRKALAFGAYDRRIHVTDADTGVDLLAPFTTGDIIKGTVTVDPDGYPLIYSGSRDNSFRVLAIDRDNKVTELWKTNAGDVAPTLWNDDWDSSPLEINDYLIEGGENSQWYVIKLNRAFGADGKVTVNPQIVFHAPGWDDQQLIDLNPNKTDRQVSIENSVAVYGHTVYFANSGGLVQGWDLTGVEKGATPKRVFRFWTGEDTDASIVIDAEGMLYVNDESERKNARAKVVGGIMKLDPTKPDNPIVWSIKVDNGGRSGFWSTPALDGDVLIAAETTGRLMGIDRVTGSIRWEKKLPVEKANPSLWASPVVVDNVLIEPDGNGDVHAYDVSNTKIDPPELWKVRIPNATHDIEATPVVFDGKIYLGSRDGFLYCLGDAP